MLEATRLAPTIRSGVCLAYHINEGLYFIKYILSTEKVPQYTDEKGNNTTVMTMISFYGE